MSLLVVLVLLVAVRLIVPSLVESVRYGWYRGQLRAEYEMSSERLRHVSLDSLASVFAVGQPARWAKRRAYQFDARVR